ncbi:nucleoside-diphosphate sugar epimerase/dehydratase [Thalassolituus oleivorans]|uniref:Putative epimerase/dehydratase n=1 Tax=Thalassolituus oleivorans MIL-1 TaxID=1298593 RepID=M5DTX1_9GAMM|nr:nucleoside-diphosphate sugar epimerase/dehydratase [Thalassolituus oleivorans]APR66694.1 nucleoside-diphosphate sugar epimerase [Thalassolituus oleivorans]CCU72668.1 putative epimerase/dehydratase [Thalassolituus oleivorans MIL-1]|tara:strand:- start:22735 stop:24627 length:1893 start_codon:yes stop_codon:yes gene_type:complete
MIRYLLDMSRSRKRLVSLAYDFVAIPLAIYMAMALRYGTMNLNITENLVYTAAITALVTSAAFIRLGLYRAVVRFMTERAFTSLMLGIAISALTLATSAFLLQAAVPRSSIIIYTFTAYMFLGVPRLFVRGMVAQLIKSNAEPVIIYGAGKQGMSLVHALSSSEFYRPVAFVDDSRKKQKTSIQGLKVWPSKQLDDLCDTYGVKKILLAVGKTNMQTRKHLIEELAERKLEILITPSFGDIISGRAKIEEVREVDIEDLLGRDCVAPNSTLLETSVRDKVVLITGAGGSIGSELCRQVLMKKPTKLVLLELNEFSLYSIEQELQATNEELKLSVPIVSILGSVQKQNRLETIFKTFNVQTIYHAAAYKHVPMVECNVVEGVRNNVFGSWYCAEAAITSGVERFILISTDKAVRPTNVMGASKRMAELVLQALSTRQTDTLFSMVRFGNVLDSSGSVVPRFRKQIKEGGPITVTHPDIIRYFMTIPEASQLVIQASAMAKGGDVFVLDMGEPVKIVSLAKKMIHLSGLTERTDINPNGDIEIQFTGLRPGEKLFEELLISEDVEGTEHPRIMTASEVHLNWPETHNLLNRLDKACHNFQVDKVISLLQEAPAAYDKQNDCTDWVLNEPNSL